MQPGQWSSERRGGGTQRPLGTGALAPSSPVILTFGHSLRIASEFRSVGASCHAAVQR